MPFPYCTDSCYGMYAPESVGERAEISLFKFKGKLQLSDYLVCKILLAWKLSLCGNGALDKDTKLLQNAQC